MNDEKFIMFRNRLQKVYRHVRRRAKRQNVSCYRVYDHDLPEFPLIIEVYEDKLHVTEYKRKHQLTFEQHDDWRRRSLTTISEAFAVTPENIFIKMRQRKAGRAGQYQKFGAGKEEYIVHEGGLKFIVNLSDYIDTGLFLDHRITRQLVRDQAQGKKILNLFCYTGAFSVYAAAGHAEEVISVDLSKTYLTWAKRNMELNGFTDDARYKYIQADVKKYLTTVPESSFDMVIMDPPTFSNSKRTDDFLDIQRDHVTLINQCLSALTADGSLWFSTNNKKFVMERDKILAASIHDVTKNTIPFDFGQELNRYCFILKKSRH